MKHDLTGVERAALLAIAGGVTECHDLAPIVGANTAAGALASIGRLIRCDLVRTVEEPGHAFPWLARSEKGRELAEALR